MAENLINRFLDTAKTCHDKTAIYSRSDNTWIELSYGKLLSCIRALADHLESNLKKGDRAAIVAGNGPEWPIIFLANLYSGNINIPINPESSPGEITNIINNSGAKLIFFHGVYKDKIYPIIKDCPSIDRVIQVDSEEFEGILKKAVSGSLVADIDDKDLACILYTSGTTDEPKGVMLSHRNLLANCDSIRKLNIILPKDRVLSILPLHHAYPLTTTMLYPLINGSSIVYPGTLRGDELSKLMMETDPSIFVAVPQIFHAFHKKMKDRFKKIPFPMSVIFNSVMGMCYSVRKKTGANPAKCLFGSTHKKFGKALKYFVSGGARLDREVAEDFFKLGFTIVEGYGLTETAPVLSLNPVAKPKIGSVGFALPDIEIKINEKDADGIGEVVARGPNIMEGYYNRRDLTDEVIKDGWFHTGDLGYMDKDGYLFLTGRSKDVIVLSTGKNIYPDEIEKVYMRDAPVKEMCVLEVQGKGKGRENEVLWAVVVPDIEFFRKRTEINLREVIKGAFENTSLQLPAYQRIMGFTITLDELPRTLLGKLKRFRVRELYLRKIMDEDEDKGPETLSEEDERLMRRPDSEKIIGLIAKQTSIKRSIVPLDSLELDLSIDSLGRVELAAGLEQLYKIKIKDEVVAESFTVRDLIVRMENVLKEGARGQKERKKPDTKHEDLDFDESYWKGLFSVPPTEINRTKIDLKPNLFNRFLYLFFNGLIYAIFRIFYNLRIYGQGNIPKQGPFMIYVNHTSFFDGPIVSVSTPFYAKWDIFFLGFRLYFDVPILRNLVKAGRIIPLDFSKHLLESLRSCYFVLDHKKNICMFPEGRISLDGNLQEFKKGFGILVKESNVKLIPAVIKGAHEAWPRVRKLPRFHPVSIRFHKAVEASVLEKRGLEMGARDKYEAICVGARAWMEGLKTEGQSK